ncbi:hypothetical protein IAG41_12140 [Sphingomonas sp. JC676]|uniref:hypothetical protein n=1 Tax=Sphingomonas sp. JC676 TaxID=2768065 RepID=UPI0016586C92|nr:hypothetical protein [Sphingomonas sp. JC676]MBC9033140.1 hypothetical protein [Sphingomonas sp. JC676]
MKRFAVLMLTLGLAVAAGFLVYLGLTNTPLFAGISILFYRGVLLCMASAILLAAALALAGRWKPLALETVVAAAALSFAFNLSFLVIFPVTLDRSISVFLLAEIEAHDGLDTPALERLFVDRYVRDMAQIDRRVAEQAQSGNITVQNGHIRLTASGRRFLALSRHIGSAFATDPRFVHPEAPRR